MYNVSNMVATLYSNSTTSSNLPQPLDHSIWNTKDAKEREEDVVVEEVEEEQEEEQAKPMSPRS